MPSRNPKSASVSQSPSTTVIVSGTPARRIKVYAVKLSISVAGTARFVDGAVDLEGAMGLTANSTYVENVNPPEYLFATTPGNDLKLTTTGALGTTSGRISYWDDDDV